MQITNGILTNVEETDIDNGTFTFPEGVTSIGNHAFYDCTSLERIVIPITVKTIGPYAFSMNCPQESTKLTIYFRYEGEVPNIKDLKKQFHIPAQISITLMPKIFVKNANSALVCNADVSQESQPNTLSNVVAKKLFKKDTRSVGFAHINIIVLGGFIATVGISTIALTFTFLNPVTWRLVMSLGTLVIVAGLGLLAVGASNAVQGNCSCMASRNVDETERTKITPL